MCDSGEASEDFIKIEKVMTFKEFLKCLPINSVQSNTWLSYNLLWYASRCLLYIREQDGWHYIPYLFSSRLAKVGEFEVFSEIATQEWCPQHLKFFSGVQFNARIATLDTFQIQAAQYGGFSLSQAGVFEFLDWEEENSAEWRTLFSERIGQLYQLAQQLSDKADRDSKKGEKAGGSGNQSTPKKDNDGNPKHSDQEDTETEVQVSDLQLQLEDRCVSLCQMIDGLARNLQKLSNLSAAVTRSVATGFEELKASKYSPHGLLVKLLLDNWAYLPPTLLLATPKSIVEAVTKDPSYSYLIKMDGEAEQLRAIEFMWNTYLLKAIQASGNFDEKATKMKTVDVEEVATAVSRKTLAESGVDASLPSMIRKIGDELKLMNVQALSRSKPAPSAIDIPGTSVAKTAEEAKRLLEGKKKQEAQKEAQDNEDIIRKYCLMSDYEIFLLGYEEQRMAQEIRRNNPDIRQHRQ